MITFADPNYSMLSRRNIRIKAFQVLFAASLSEDPNPQSVLKKFDENMKQLEWMYWFLATLPPYFADYLESEKEMELEKYFPNQEKIKQYSCFIHNPINAEMQPQIDLEKKLKFSPFQWTQYGELFVKMFKAVKEQPFFTAYYQNEEPTRATHIAFLLDFYGYLFEHHEEFNDEIGGAYLDWDNDLPVLYKMLKKTLKAAEDEPLKIIAKLELEEEDYDFAHTLITQTLVNQSTYSQYVQDATKNWDPSRILKSDITLINMAITEFLYMTIIPVKVSINEYIELAKSFSSDKSHIFINGILDRIKHQFTETGKFQKEGRGLRDN